MEVLAVMGFVFGLLDVVAFNSVDGTLRFALGSPEAS